MEKKTQTIHDLKCIDMISTERNHTNDTHQNNSDEDLKYLLREGHTDDTMKQHSIDIHVTNAACHGHTTNINIHCKNTY